MENAEEIFHFLEDFSKRKPKTIPQELNDYLAYVARTGDPVYQWPVVKCLFKEKLLNVITDFYEPTSSIDIPSYPNVDPFDYDTLKNSLIERLDTFTSAPFTVQRICELLTFPRKQYNRVDKYMRAIEKNILVVSTREPGTQRPTEAENGEPVVNGSDNNSEYNVDVEMEDMSWKETKEPPQNSEPQPSSSESYSIAEIEARLRAKQGFPPVSVDKPSDAFTPTHETDQITDKQTESEDKISNFTPEAVPSTSDTQKIEEASVPDTNDKMDMDEKAEEPSIQAIVIPEIKINDTSIDDEKDNIELNQADDKVPEQKVAENKSVLEELPSNETDPEMKPKEIEIEPKMISEVIEMSSSSEESSSSSDNTDGNSNSPKAVPDDHMDEKEINKVETENTEPTVEANTVREVAEKSPPPVVMQSDNYSITDVNSELPQMTASSESKSEEPMEEKMDSDEKDSEEQKTDNENETETEMKTDNNEATTPV